MQWKKSETASLSLVNVMDAACAKLWFSQLASPKYKTILEATDG